MAIDATKHPWKLLYYAYQVPISCMFSIVWSATYILPSMRPRPTWSWSHSLAVAFIRRYTSVFAVNQVGQRAEPDYRAIVPAKDMEGVWIDGVPHLITVELKIWTAVSEVQPIRVPGYWYSKKGIDPKPSVPVQRGEKAFLYLHGGGYVTLSAHISSVVSSIVRFLVEASDAAPRALSVEYRLSSTHPLPVRHPFPTALLDALAGYNYLVNVAGYDPADIIIAGDSAGGNLTLALSRYLVENQDATGISLPAPPGRLLLLSPWTDMGNSHDLPGSSILTYTEDILADFDSGPLRYMKQAFLGPYGLGMASYNRYISPGSLNPSVKVSFRGFPPTFIVAGTAERLYDQILTLRDKMIVDMGEENVTCYKAGDAIHDHLILPWHPECFLTQGVIQQWLAS